MAEPTIMDEKGKKLNPDAIKRYIRALAIASRKHECKQAAKKEIIKQLESLKQVTGDKNATKEQIYDVVANLEEKLGRVIKDEKELLEEQKQETKLIDELRQKVEKLNSKLQQVEDISKTKLSAQEEARQARLRRLDEIEQKIKLKQQQEEEAKQRGEEIEVAQIEAQLEILEKKHDELVKSGQHPESHLNKLKQIIDNHKKSLDSIKKENVTPLPSVSGAIQLPQSGTTTVVPRSGTVTVLEKPKVPAKPNVTPKKTVNKKPVKKKVIKKPAKKRK